MIPWNTDITAAPRGKYRVLNRKFGKGQADTRVFEPDLVILATQCGVVTVSSYLPAEDGRPARWNMLAAGEQPVAWMHYADAPRRMIETKTGTREVVETPAHPTIAQPWWRVAA